MRKAGTTLAHVGRERCYYLAEVGPDLSLKVRTFLVVAVVCAGLLFSGRQTAAQGLTFALLTRYVDALRQQAGIPGLALAIVRNGQVVGDWQRGFGVANADGAVPVDPDTPFSIADLSQTIAAALVLRNCIDGGRLDIDDAVRRWSPSFPDNATVGQLLAHSGPGGYRYDRKRFEGLTDVAEECGRERYAMLTFDEIIRRFAMINSSPGGDVVVPGSPASELFPLPTIRAFDAVLRRMAVPYQVDGGRRVRSDYRVPSLTAAGGMVASVRDLANFEAGIDNGTIIRAATLRRAWSKQYGGPMGWGWFVQRVNNAGKEKDVVWHFGLEPNAYSSLVIKVPRDGLTLILLANSDGLAAPFKLENGDVTVSPFAKIFFTLLG